MSKRHQAEPILDSTCISGQVLKRLPPGNLIGFMRYDTNIAIIWQRVDEKPFREQLFDLRTGFIVDESRPVAMPFEVNLGGLGLIPNLLR